MLDRDGYRPNVGIILINSRNEVFWGKRIREHAWQFPQGGIKRGESPEQAMYRELHEEVGLLPEHVRVIGRTREWLRYEVPEHWIRREFRGHYRGQKQIWFLIRLIGRDTDIDLRASGHPEFDAWRWSHFWVPLEAVIEFKREVYRLALMELSRMLPRPGSGRGYSHPGSDFRSPPNGSRRRPPAPSPGDRAGAAGSALERSSFTAPQFGRPSAPPQQFEHLGFSAPQFGRPSAPGRHAHHAANAANAVNAINGTTLPERPSTSTPAASPLASASPTGRETGQGNDPQGALVPALGVLPETKP